MKTKQAFTQTDIKNIVSVLGQHFDKNALANCEESAEALHEAIRDCFGVIKNKVAAENNPHYLRTYLDQVKYLKDVQTNLEASIKEYNEEVADLKKQILEMIK